MNCKVAGGCNKELERRIRISEVVTSFFVDHSILICCGLMFPSFFLPANKTSKIPFLILSTLDISILNKFLTITLFLNKILFFFCRSTLFTSKLLQSK